MTQPVRTGKPAKKADDKPSPLWIMLVFLAIGLGVPGWSLCSMADDLLLHYRGVPPKKGFCDISAYHGPRTGTSTTMIVDYTAADGSKHFDSTPLIFASWPRDPDQSVPCEIRYSPTSPDRYSTSWGFSRLPSRFIAFLSMQSWLLMMGLFSLGELAGRIRRLFGRRAPT